MRLNAKQRVASRWIPAGSVKVKAEEINAVVYLYERFDGLPGAVAYSGTRGKEDFHNAYLSKESRLKAINKWRKSMAEHLNWKAEQKAARSKPHGLKNGAIFVWSWGYGQTNLSFYQVVSSTPHTVNVREVTQKTVPGSEGLMCDSRIAVKDKFIGEEFRKKVGFTKSGPYLSMEHGWCGLWDGKPHYCSWYH